MGELAIAGLTPLTTIDFPDHLACVVFCQGCPLRCGYCHNPDLLDCRKAGQLPWQAVKDFLLRRQGLLDGVVFSGGEPTVQNGLSHAIDEVSGLGFRVALHSAGTHPRQLATVLGKLDWVGLDIKALPEDSLKVTGVARSGVKNWQSLEMVQHSGVAFECCTTVHPALLTADQLRTLAGRLRDQGVRRYALQWVRGTRMLDSSLGLAMLSEEWLETIQEIQSWFPQFEFRRD